MGAQIVSPRIKVGLVQVAEISWIHRRRQQYHLVDGQLMPKPVRAFRPDSHFVYLPLAVASLQAYAQRYARKPSDFEFLPPVYKRLPVDEAVDAILQADIVAFSLYVWNVNLSLSIAKRLKECNPKVLVVVGGPQVPKHCEAFLREHREIDIACHGEGEQTFLEILERDEITPLEEIGSISFLDAQAAYHATSPRSRMLDLQELPSPFLGGVFDGLLAANPNQQWLVLWETNRGCPFSCSFCDWGSAVGAKVAKISTDRLYEEIDWFVANRISYLFVCDANYGIFPRDLEITRRLVERYDKSHLQLAISVQSAKNAPERSYEIQRELSVSKLVTFGVTLSMQSVSANALTAVRRSNISQSAFRLLHERYRRDRVETYTDLIVGLPGETYDSFADGISYVIDQGQHNRIALYNCSILPNAEMGSEKYQQIHRIEYVPVEIIREHERLHRREREGVREYLNTVVATATMDRDAWVQTRVFAWLTDLLHFYRLLQIVFVVLRKTYGVSYRRMIEAFLFVDETRYPVCGGIRNMLVERAHGIQRGEPDLVPSPEYLNIWWPTDQFALVTIVAEGKLTNFYDEATRILTDLLQSQCPTFDPVILRDARTLNEGTFRIPEQLTDLEIVCEHNVLEIYQATLCGENVALRPEPSRYRIDRTSTVWIDVESYFEDVIAQFHRRSDFLYPVKEIALEEVKASEGSVLTTQSLPAAVGYA
jgi:radical SAM superfamily enzyme YgiQ (UPF0313 family)